MGRSLGVNMVAAPLQCCVRKRGYDVVIIDHRPLLRKRKFFRRRDVVAPRWRGPCRPGDRDSTAPVDRSPPAYARSNRWKPARTFVSPRRSNQHSKRKERIMTRLLV